MTATLPGFTPRGEHERWVLFAASRPTGLRPGGIAHEVWPQRSAAAYRLAGKGILRWDGLRWSCVQITPGRFLPPPPDETPPDHQG